MIKTLILSTLIQQLVGSKDTGNAACSNLAMSFPFRIVVRRLIYPPHINKVNGVSKRQTSSTSVLWNERLTGFLRFLKLGLQGTAIIVASGDSGVAGFEGDQGNENGCLGPETKILIVG